MGKYCRCGCGQLLKYCLIGQQAEIKQPMPPHLKKAIQDDIDQRNAAARKSRAAKPQ